jgi:hypothetical protein
MIWKNSYGDFKYHLLGIFPYENKLLDVLNIQHIKTSFSY